MKKLPADKTIPVIAFITAIGGLVIEYTPFMLGSPTNDFSTIKLVLYSIFQTVNLDFFRESLYMVDIGNGSSVGLNVPNFLFYLLLLIGTILFAVKGFRKSRIIEFCYSVIFFSMCAGVFWTLYRVVRNFGQMRLANVGWTILWLAVIAMWLWVSWYVLKSTRSQRDLKISHYETDGGLTPTFEEADKFKRFYNWIIDRVLIILIFSPWSYYFSGSISSFEDMAGSRTVVYLLYILGSFIYYPFFEKIFGATPGKFLSGTRVTDEFGNSPSFLNIVGRTLCRFVPFDGISFLGSAGWHDKWSDTYVLKEKTKATDQPIVIQ